MSQSGTYEIGNPGLLDVTSLTGNDGLIVVPDGAGNIDVLGDDIFISTSRTGANTLTISLNNTVTNTAQTIGAVTADIITLSLNIPLTAISVVAEIIGAADDYTGSCSLVITGGARREALGGAILAGTPDGFFSANDLNPAEADIVVSGNNIIVRVTGKALTTINWKAVVRLQVIDL